MGSQTISSLWAHVWGRARPQLKNASNELVAVGAPMFARHGVSRLWTAATTNGTVLVTWESFFLWNRKEVEARGGGEEWTNNLFLVSQTEEECLSNHSPPQASTSTFSHPSINAQLELFPSGDFIARLNEVERVYRRVNPDDWDDDGIPNEEDDDPRVTADDSQFGSRQTLPEDANENAYCWVDLVVPQANALVTFAGDGASNLADPSFIAKAGETNRVTLLIGKTYRVTCPLPLRIVAKSSDEIEEAWQSDGSLLLRWPVSVSSTVTETDDSSAAQRAAIRQASSVGISSLAVSPVSLLAATTTALPASRSHTFVMSVVPSGLGGLFDWTTHCCSISGTAYTFEQTCRGACACSGCTTEGFFEYEGYQLRVYGPSCPCSGSPPDDHHGEDEDEDPPARGVSAYFTESVIFLEDEYENAPGKTVPWQSTETKLVCSAAGGPFGGCVKIEITGADNLIQYTGPTLPFEQTLAAGEDLSFKIRYRAAKESGAADDIKVMATFTENETEWEQVSRDTATAIRLEFKPEVRAPENRSERRHRYGVRELVRWTQKPSAPKVSWSLTAGEIIENEERYRCPLNAASSPLTACCRGSEYKPAISVVEPQLVRVRDPSWDDFDAPNGEAGSIVMLLPLYIFPLDVSFANIAVEEVPYEDHPIAGDTHTGYFARNDLALWWHHTRLNGAGIWRNVREANRMGGENVFDQAGVTETLSRVNSSGLFVDDPNCGWSDGRIVMATPFGWNETDTQGKDLPFKMFATDVRAVLDLQADGTFRVEKLGNKVIRHVGGEVFLNGVRQK